MIGSHRLRFQVGKRRRDGKGTAALQHGGAASKKATTLFAHAELSIERISGIQLLRRWAPDRAISLDLSVDPSRHRTTIIRRFGFVKQTSRLDRFMQDGRLRRWV
jgi:hypothetical protein